MFVTLNFIVVVGLFFPALASSFPQNSRWKQMYEEMQAAENAGQQNPVQDSRSLLLHKALETLIRLQNQEQQQQQKASSLTSSRLLSPRMMSSHLMPVPAGNGFLLEGDRYPPQKDLLARLLGLGVQVVPSSGASASAGGRLHYNQPLNVPLSQARKRFVEAPVGAGGANMGSCPSKCRSCYRHRGVWRCSG